MVSSIRTPLRTLVDLLSAMAEKVRHSRAVAGALQTSDDPVQDWTPLNLGRTADERLPLNRKERYYTGTVLPMIVAADGFAHLHRFLHLSGLRVNPAGANPLVGGQDIQFFTEYGFAESVFTARDKERFGGHPVEHDTLTSCSPGLTGYLWLRPRCSTSRQLPRSEHRLTGSVPSFAIGHTASALKTSARRMYCCCPNSEPWRFENR